jgi:rod shape determining protein RodA
MALSWPEPRVTTAERLLSLAIWLIPPLALIIGAIGVATLYSVGGGSMEPWAMRHILRLILGLGLMLSLSMVPLWLWRSAAYPLYTATLLAIVAVMMHGTQALGAQRWLSLGAVSLQPSEVMNIAVILVLARYYHDLQPVLISNPWRVGIAAAVVIVPSSLILRQPDLGTAVLIALTGIIVMFLAGVAWHYFLAGAVTVLGVVPFIWSWLHDYQKERVLVFLDPSLDPLGKGYQIYQSKIALGSGGWVGRGLLHGTQTQLDFVPEKHTDFVFALWAEETGFIGSALLIALFLALVWCLMALALRCRAVFARLVIAGVAISLFLHVFVNIAMVAGSAPVVGVPLPLISYGGTSLFSLMFGLGLAISAARGSDSKRLITASPEGG